MTNYSDKLKDPRWQRKRLQILERDHWTCLFCGDKETTLHVHHLVYVKDGDPWDADDDDLITLCAECHEGEKEYRPAARRELNRALERAGMDTSQVEDFASLVDGVGWLPAGIDPDRWRVAISYCLHSGMQAKYVYDAYFGLGSWDFEAGEDA